MNAIKINKITFEGHEVKIAGLNNLLSDINLWSKKKSNLHQGYKRKVIQKDGKFITHLRR